MPVVVRLLLLALLLTACGGADPAEPTATGAAAPATTPATTAAPTASATATATAAEGEAPESPTATPVDADAAAAEELPQFASDFERVCSTGVGFGGAASYEATAGVHPVVLFEEQSSGTVITASVTLPAGWLVEEDADFDDSTELAATELVACATVAAETPNGTSCDLEGDDGSTTTLQLVDATYDLRIHNAVTGEEVGATTIEAASTECPFFVFVEEGQTEYLNSPTDEQYTQALQPYVSP